MEKLSYEVKKDIKSVYNYFDLDSDILNFLDNQLNSTKYITVVYLDNEVKIGYLKKNTNNYSFLFHDNSNIEDKFIQKIRVFNENEEILIWKTNNKFKARHIKDEQGSETEYVDVNQVLFGTKSEKLENQAFTKLLEEKRGIELIIGGNFETSTSKKRVAIQTRNYVEYNSIYQAIYSDCRFIKFVQLGV
ncbi:MAG: CRISPR-associated protein Csx19 [Candidatus Sericytochromatia bacterium]